MFFDKLHFKFKRILARATATVLSVSALTLALASPVPVMADSTSSDTQNSVSTSTFKFANIDLQVDVSDDLVCFTQNVTSNNAYLDKIGAEDAETLRNSMIAANIYMEAIPKESEAVTYEIIIVGDKLESTEVTDLSALSEDELNNLYKDYISGINKKTDKIEETLNMSGIKNINDVYYFFTEVSAVSHTNMDIQLMKYYTIKNGYYYTFSIQTTEKAISDDMERTFNDIVQSAQYKEIKAGLFDSPIFSEFMSIFLTSVAPVAILGVILFVSIKMTSKKKKY